MKITRFIAALYHKQHYDKYFMRKYADKPPLIYYDKKQIATYIPKKSVNMDAVSIFVQNWRNQVFIILIT